MVNVGEQTLRRLTALVATLGWIAVVALPATAWAQEAVFPCTAEPTDMMVAYGDVVNCSIAVSGDSDIFRFSGNVGDVIVIQGAIGASSSVRPCVELVVPGGGQLQACANAFVNRIDTTLTVSGTHIIQVRDQASVFTGAYTMTLERLIPPSSRARQISYGQTLLDQINIKGDLDLFVFSGSLGDSLSIIVANVSPSSVRPCVELISPANTRAIACNNAFNNQILTMLSHTGVFVILARDMSNFFMGNYSLDVQCLSGPCVRGPTLPPGPPTSLTTSVSGFTVTLNWAAPAGGGAPTSYVIEAGSATGAANLVVFDTGNTQTSFTTIGVGLGTYFVRVRARNAAGTSGPSNEVVVIVGGGPGPCTGPPGAPSGLTLSINGSIVTLMWSAASGQPTAYVIEAGLSSGTSNLANFQTGNADTTLTVAAPPGTYFVRIRARNACGTSGPSNEIVVIVGSVPGPPSGLTVSINGAIVTLTWNAASGQLTTYVIEAGSSSGASDLASFQTGNVATTFMVAAPPGTYFVRLRARNAFGTSGPSNEVVVIVPSPPVALGLQALNTGLGSASPGTLYPRPLEARVTDASGAGVPGQVVTWDVGVGSGWVFPSRSTSDPNGIARTQWIAGAGAAYAIIATVSNSAGTATAQWVASKSLPAGLPGNNAAGLSNIASPAATAYRMDIVPLTDPPGTYYAALQWDGGYTGLQRGGDLFDRQVHFSVWDRGSAQTTVVDAGVSTCARFGGEGTGVKCRFSHNWRNGETYRFEVEVGAVTTGSNVTAWFTDIRTGSRIRIATLREAGVPNLTGFGCFNEDFVRRASTCLDRELRQVVFKQPAALVGGSWTPLRTAFFAYPDPLTTCANIAAWHQDSGVLVSVGGSLVGDPNLPRQITFP
jgi:Domain of unknown function (DUF3472)